MTNRQSNVSRTPGAIEFGKLSLELRRRSYRDAEFASRYMRFVRSPPLLASPPGAPVAVRVSTNVDYKFVPRSRVVGRRGIEVRACVRVSL